ncbi:MAG: phosphatase [Flavobacteriales bacterium]|nr:phosphatase [Flavobacteriales bacterium]
MNDLRTFSRLGTRFLRPPDHLQRSLAGVRCLLLDWDGVFNDGWKDPDGGSPFSEVDSMGLNLLRFGLWLVNRRLPVCAIITGQHNPTAEHFAQREHLHAVYMGFTHKLEALEQFRNTHAIDDKQVAFFFDDVLDLPLARRCGLRIMVDQPASPLFENYVSSKLDADLLTHLNGGRHGLREACELLLALMGRYDEVVEHRLLYSDPYKAYLADRNAVDTTVVRNPR